MRRKAFGFSLVILCTFISACGGNSLSGTKQAQVGSKGCLSKVCHKAQPITKRSLQKARKGAFPDIWEGDPYAVGHLPTVIRLSYGDHFEDTHAKDNAARLRSWHVWFGGYTYLTGGGCSSEGQFIVKLAKGLGLNGPIILDGEISLGHGYIDCVGNYIASHAPRYPVVTYTGCYSGLEIFGPWWVPDYGVGTPCTRNGHNFSAWQYTENGVCGESWAGDCSLNYGLLSLYPRPICNSSCKLNKKLRKTLEVDISHRSRQERLAKIHEHKDLVAYRRLKVGSKQRQSLENDRRYNLDLIKIDERLINHWRHLLSKIK